MVINSKNQIILYNQAAEKLWGYSKNEVIGENVKVLVSDDIKPNHDNLINRNRETGVNKIIGTTREVPIVCKDGSRKWGSMSISKVYSDEKILYTAFIKDVTEDVLARKYLELLSLVTDKTDNAIVIVDKNWESIYINQGFTTLFGYVKSEVLGVSPISIIAPNLSPLHINLYRQNHLNGEAIKRDEMLQAKNGERLWCSIMSNPILDENGGFTHSVIILSEITNTKLHEILHQKVLNSIAHDLPLEFIMSTICDEINKICEDATPVIFKVDEDNNLQLLSSPKLPTLQQNERKYSLEDLNIIDTDLNEPILLSNLKRDPFWLIYEGELAPLNYTGCLSIPIKGNDNVIGVLSFYYKKNKEPSDLHHILLKIILPLCTLAIEREKQRDNIKKLAYYDTLTKLPNRSLLLANAEQALEDAQSNTTKLAFLFLDVDRFKHINDSFGHPIGDQVLLHLATRLTTSTVQNFNAVGRLSGDEFIIVTSFSDNSNLTNIVEELRLQITRPILINDNEIITSMSIGISTFPDDGSDVGMLIQRADLAMYQAKSTGKGRFAYFSHELNKSALELQKIETELGKAIANNELKLFYQPQVSMDDGSIYGIEALARWEHPKLGHVLPSKFIPIAEDCGLISDLSHWAIHTACKQMSLWKSQGIEVPTISVNLSPINFRNINLCELIMCEIKSFSLKTSDLILELTESVLLDTNPSTMKVLLDIHNEGIHFSMDDFGTGYASLSYLQKIPIKELKLDRSFVLDIEKNHTNKALSNAVLQIGKSLNIDVVAEGIETIEQYQILKEQGYKIAQGYLFSEPLSSKEVENWLMNNRRVDIY